MMTQRRTGSRSHLSAAAPTIRKARITLNIGPLAARSVIVTTTAMNVKTSRGTNRTPPVTTAKKFRSPTFVRRGRAGAAGMPVASKGRDGVERMLISWALLHDDPVDLRLRGLDDVVGQRGVVEV